MSFLKIEGFFKNFEKTEVLKGIDFELQKGEILAVIGSSGSGKTTLLRCLNFLEKPDAGRMELDGEVLIDSLSLTKDSEGIMRKKRLNFGLVFQSFNLFPQYNLLKNVTLAPELQLKENAAVKKRELKGEIAGAVTKEDKIRLKKRFKSELKRFCAEAKNAIDADAHAIIGKVGLTEKKSAYPHELSGGQQQRAAIARALALKPKVLCFDEPTSALDPELTGEVLKVIKSLKSQDNTMIIVTHEMEFAKNVADKIMFMYDGVVEEFGAADEVFNHPKSEKTKAFLAGNLSRYTE